MKLRQLVIAALAFSGAATLAAANTDVSEAQQALNDKGFNAGPVDGVAGPKTQAALKQFQQSQGLQASGKLDQQTLSALESSGGTQASDSSSSSQPSDSS